MEGFAETVEVLPAGIGEIGIGWQSGFRQEIRQAQKGFQERLASGCELFRCFNLSAQGYHTNRLSNPILTAGRGKLIVILGLQ